MGVIKQLLCRHNYQRIEVKNADRPHVVWYCSKCQNMKIER